MVFGQMGFLLIVVVVFHSFPLINSGASKGNDTGLNAKMNKLVSGAFV